MKEILFTIMMFAFFAFGYYLTDRFGKFMDKNYRAYQDPSAADRIMYVTETKGKSVTMISKEVSDLLDSLPDQDEYEIIICKNAAPCIRECMEESGCQIEYNSRQ